MSELLSKEQLAEIERWSKGPTTETWFNSAQQQVTALLAHCRALEAERDAVKDELAVADDALESQWNLFREERARLREVEAERGVLAGMVANFHKEHRDALVEQFRQRAVDAIGGLPPADESCETFDIEQVIKLLQSLPAISELEKNSGDKRAAL